ncbi:glycosyl hydrolase family 88 [Vallitalea longa]|uniref:Glycosyl hydrolase family 88 n=1 Tax=Vallitalea longa TaxID=2936439 RepID=A0A9W5YEW7_9FIRM|nr:glycoside hydrolase family 88 protein [Vallitalea longa]GKX31451.1 glycosyl hydrolase family 88 [Vallitalea longa]
MLSVNKWVYNAWEDVINKIKKTSVNIGNRFPSMSVNGKYSYTEDTWRWVTGFWPGLLWLLYEDTKYKPFKEIALSCEKIMDQSLKEYTNLHHDVGFMWMLTSIKHYKMTGNLESRRRGLIAASYLSSRFNCAGNFLVAWNTKNINRADNRGLSIIDSMMNLPILFWATEESGDPRFSHFAKAHAATVLKYFIRDDGSVNHMVEFNPYTGEMIRVHSGQGHSITSAWSRGTSWALYGMALAYKYTKDNKYLEASKKVADFFIRELPEDSVPHWDFKVPREKDTPRDTSAGACAACGLLELSQHLNGKDKLKYFNKAQSIVKSMYENYGNWDNKNDGLLRGGTFNYPKGLGIDVSLIYGDYYFVEALARLKAYK